MNWNKAAFYSLVTMLCLQAESKGIDLLDTANTYDYIIVRGSQDFISDADWLREYRAADGLRTVIVTDLDIAMTFGGGQLSDDALRAFIVYAYHNWRIAPTYVVLLGRGLLEGGAGSLIPIHYRYNEHFEYWGVHDYADEWWYVGSTGENDNKPIMRIGRIPATDAAELSNALTHIYEYDTIGEETAWRERMSTSLVLIGDRPQVQEESRILGERLVNETLNGLDVTTFYGHDYPGVGTATADVREEWDTGHGMVLAFGNTLSLGVADNPFLVYMVHINQNGSPTFTETLGNTYYLPVLLSGSCLVTEFFYPTRCQADDFLFSKEEAGAVAVVGPCHMAPVLGNYHLSRVFLEGARLPGVRDLGQLVARTMTEYTRDLDPELEFIASTVCLLGDPAMKLRWLQHPANTVWQSGCEIEDNLVQQDKYVGQSQGVSDPWTRIVHKEGAVNPIGSRMFRATLTDTDQNSQGEIRWHLASPMVDIDRNNILLSFWSYVSESPDNTGHISIDLRTESSTWLSTLPDWIFDQEGQPLVPDQRFEPLDRWAFHYVDLSSVTEAIEEVALYYKATLPTEMGNLTVYIDNIRIGAIDDGSALEEVLNGSFDLDVNADNIPDGWTDATDYRAIWTSDVDPKEGRHCLVISDPYCAGAGARHVFHTGIYDSAFDFGGWFRSAEPSEATVEIRDAADGYLVHSEIVTVETAWGFVYFTFLNPYAYISPGRLEIVIQPCHCEDVLYADEISVTIAQATSVGSGKPDRAARVVWPNPTAAGTTFAPGFNVSDATRATVYDVQGRVLRVLTSRDGMSQGLVCWDGCLTNGDRAAPGIYYILCRDGKEIAKTKIVLAE